MKSSRTLIVYHLKESGASKSVLTLEGSGSYYFVTLPKYKEAFGGTLYALIQILFYSFFCKNVILNGLATIVNPNLKLLIKFMIVREKKLFIYWHEGQYQWRKSHKIRYDLTNSLALINKYKESGITFIANSRRVASWLQEEFNLGKSPVVLYDTFSPQEKKIDDQQIQCSEDKIQIVVVASVQQRKGIKKFLDLCDIEDDRYCFKWIGRKVEWNSEWDSLVEDIKSKWGEDRIEFLGYINEPFRKISNTSCFLLLSIDEPFGIVYAEALSAGLFTIVSPNSGFSELVTENSKACFVYQDYHHLHDFLRMANKDTFYHKDKLRDASKIINQINVSSFERNLTKILSP